MKASIEVKEIEVTEIQKKEFVKLIMTKEEADVLFALMGDVYGDASINENVRIAHNIYGALSKAFNSETPSISLVYEFQDDSSYTFESV